MLNFTLFGIPVRIEPWFWLTGFLLGRGISMKDREDLIQVLIWMIVLLFSILVHEFGHALVGRKFNGRQPHVRLWAFGGLAYNDGPFSRKERLLMILAGPGAGLAFFVLIVAGLLIRFGPEAGANVVLWFALGSEELLMPDRSGLRVVYSNPVTIGLVSGLIMFNLWWSLVNLLPVYPLDGGQAYSTLEPSMKKVFQVGMYTGIATAVVGFLVFKEPLVTLLFGFLAFQNYQNLKSTGY